MSRPSETETEIATPGEMSTPSSEMTYEMTIPKICLPLSMFYGGRLHKKGTIVINIIGLEPDFGTLPEEVDAYDNATQKLITKALYGPGEVPKGGVLGLYRFMEPTIWYLNLTKRAHTAVYKKLDGKKIPSKKGIELHLEHLEKRKLK